jgi:hypothetical protein
MQAFTFEGQDMTIQNAARVATPWFLVAGASALTATIVVVAPEVGAGMLGSLIAAWAVLGIVRVVIVVGIARQIYHRLDAVRAA